MVGSGNQIETIKHSRRGELVRKSDSYYSDTTAASQSKNSRNDSKSMYFNSKSANIFDNRRSKAAGLNTTRCISPPSACESNTDASRFG